ncbi:phospholipase A1-like [Onthophagus taurus]|uniref:phospholipase A1-like n=1 Tax=Onthophagus taurus TaxID=166361 RepID=UPI000C207B35|nr:phospholipase A1-like [Onthophagus taurus]
MYLIHLLTLCALSNLFITKSYSFEEFKENKVHFYLWNRNVQEQEIGWRNTGNIIKARTKFLIHGYLDKGNGEDFFFYGPLTRKYLASNNTNVICVDWSFYSRRLYPDSVLWLRSVANLTANLIMELNKKGIPFSDVHLLGHSLGAHMAGFIGKYIQQENMGTKIYRITGLDPAGPLFHRRPTTDKLYKTDAENVDTVIADIRLFGMNQRLGQVNIYANCGGRLKDEAINHLLAPYYYGYGILKDDLIAKRCNCVLDRIVSSTCKPEPTNILGQNVNFKKQGTYVIEIDIIPMMKDALDSMRNFEMNKMKINFKPFIDGIIQKIKKNVNLK